MRVSVFGIADALLLAGLLIGMTPAYAQDPTPYRQCTIGCDAAYAQCVLPYYSRIPRALCPKRRFSCYRLCGPPGSSPLIRR